MTESPTDRAVAERVIASGDGRNAKWGGRLVNVPTVLISSGYRFFFFSLEGQEPPHVHVEQAERYAKVWLAPLALARSRGFRNSEISEIVSIVRKNREYFQEKWDEHFKR